MSVRKIGLIFGFVALLHLVGWALLFYATEGGQQTAAGTAISIGTGTLAYLLGLRHAFDADHIAAIDNTTRKLISEGQKPTSVGLFFSLGHSTVVFVLSALIAVGVSWVGKELTDEGSLLRQTGAIIGGTVAGTFLLFIAIINIFIFLGIIKNFRSMRTGTHATEHLEEELHKRGIMSRLLAPISKTIDRSWKMYPLGLLFGLGFDTASSIALLALAGSSAIAGNAALAVIALPIIFTAGMALGDTVDGLFMNQAYGWAHEKPIRRAYYNMTVTLVSITAALAVGVPVILGVLIDAFHLEGGIWDTVANIDLENVGFILVGIFLTMWALSVLIWRIGNFEQKWQPIQEQEIKI